MSYTKFYEPEQMRIAGEILLSLLVEFQPPCRILLFVYTYEPGAVSFVANYPERADVLDVVFSRLKRWETNAPPMLYEREIHGWLPQLKQLKEWHELLMIKLKELAPGCGYALFAGKGEFTQYQASGDREGCEKMLRAVVAEARSEMA